MSTGRPIHYVPVRAGTYRCHRSLKTISAIVAIYGNNPSAIVASMITEVDRGSMLGIVVIIWKPLSIGCRGCRLLTRMQSALFDTTLLDLSFLSLHDKSGSGNEFATLFTQLTTGSPCLENECRYT